MHWRRLKEGRSHNKVLQFAWNMFGPSNMSFRVLEECKPADLKIRETHHLETCGMPLFNILNDSRRPPTFSAAVRKKLSRKAKAQHRRGKFGRATWRAS